MAPYPYLFLSVQTTFANLSILQPPPLFCRVQVDLYIDRLPRLPKDHSYKCIFDRREQTVATPTAFGLSCLLPKVMHRTQIQPGRGKFFSLLCNRSGLTPPSDN